MVLPSASVSLLVLPYLVSCSTSIWVLVMCIQFLISCRLAMALMPLQLREAIVNLAAYVALLLL